MTGEIPPSPSLPKEGEDLEPGTWNLEPALAWLDYCLGETLLALAAVKGAALEGIKTIGTTGGTPVPPGWIESYLAMCEAAAGLISLRGRAARGFRASCPPSSEPRQADET